MDGERSEKNIKLRRSPKVRFANLLAPQPPTSKPPASKIWVAKGDRWRFPRFTKARGAAKRLDATNLGPKSPKSLLARIFSPQVGLWTALTLAATVVGGGAWLGVQLIVNPQSVLWLNRIVPDWVPVPVTGLKPPQTLVEIRKDMTKAGRIAGSPLWLNPAGSFSESRDGKADVLFPVLFKPANCTADCEQIVELRLYQAVPDRLSGNGSKKSEAQFQLVDQISISGPDETEVTAPLVEAKAAKPGTLRSLPLKALSRLEGTKSLPGVWLNLVGWLIRGDRTTAYGQILHFNPKQMHLGTLLDWSSPTGEEPQWQNVTGSSDPELVVDQTVGLEPKFKIYQVRSLKGQPTPVKLEPITLAVSAIQQPTYTNAIALARSGLWSPAAKQLDFFKQQKSVPWTAAAEAQRDFIQWHAKVTQTQADRTWASASQQALVNILDGRWEKALKIFQEKPENAQDIAELLRTDTGQIQNRVDATLKVTPAHQEAKIWGALLAAVQKGGKAGAILWLRKQPQTPAADIKKIMTVVARLAPAATTTAVMPTATNPGQVIGTAQAIAQIDPYDWRQPESSPPLKLEAAQTWYRVQVSRVFDGKRWRSPNDLNLAAYDNINALWQRLGFKTDPFLQVVLWSADGQQQTLYVSIKAVRLGGSSGLEILAAGDALPPAQNATGKPPLPLAFSDYAVQWFSPSTASLADWVQQQPTWARQAIPILARELKTAKALPPDTAPNWADLAPLGIGTWTVQLAPITHPTRPDVLLTLYPEMLPQPGQPGGKPRTLIFSGTGQLLYSEFSLDAGQTHLALATLGNNGPLTLVVAGHSSYNLLRWSPKDQAFR